MTALVAALAVDAHSAEMITLKTGFSIQVENHHAEGDQLILNQAGGSISVPASEVVSIEPIAEDSGGAVSGGTPGTMVASSKTKESGDKLRIIDKIEAQRLISSASDAEGLPATFVLSVAHVESAFVANARSAKGAIGLMQLMPGTANALGVSAVEPAENVLGGTRYLRQLLIRYGGDARLALAAYNAGPAAVDRFGGVPPFRETQLYVERVLREYARRLSAEPAAEGNAQSAAGHKDPSF